jgi:hypothetical protein
MNVPSVWNWARDMTTLQTMVLPIYNKMAAKENDILRRAMQ